MEKISKFTLLKEKSTEADPKRREKEQENITLKTKLQKEENL